jgi:hypothetical protein
VGKLIRRGVFETNSSSTHSITIGSDTDLLGFSPNTPDNGIEIRPDYFGWNHEIYRSVESRLSYILIYIRDWSGDKHEKFTQVLTNVVNDHTGAVYIKLIEDEEEDGYIDHQSVEYQNYHYLFEDPSVLKTFLFSKDGYVETDNDNH